MSKLILSDSDIKQAIVTHYEAHHTELYEKYDFENIEVRYVIDSRDEIKEFGGEAHALGAEGGITVEVEERKQ